MLNLIHKAAVLEQAKEQTDVKAKERKKASESRTHAASVLNVCVFPEWHSCPIPALPDFIPTSRSTVLWISRIYKDVSESSNTSGSRKQLNILRTRRWTDLAECDSRVIFVRAWNVF